MFIQLHWSTSDETNPFSCSVTQKIIYVYIEWYRISASIIVKLLKPYFIFTTIREVSLSFIQNSLILTYFVIQRFNENIFLNLHNFLLIIMSFSSKLDAKLLKSFIYDGGGNLVEILNKLFYIYIYRTSSSIARMLI